MNKLPPRVTAEDRNAHRAFVQTLGGDAVWGGYLGVTTMSWALADG